MVRPVPSDSRDGKTGNLSYSNIFEYAQVHIIIYSYCIVFIFRHIHIQGKPPRPYRIHAYLNIFKINFFVPYFWPALLWLRSYGTVPTRSWFIGRLQNFFSDSIAGQSKRADGATRLAESGALPHVIQAAGRWTSDIFVKIRFYSRA
jgi:hypothetical protein